MNSVEQIALAKALEKRANEILTVKPAKKVWIPSKVENGRFTNVTQGLVVSKGPRAGRYVTGKQSNQEYWRPGQHIMKRQRNPKDPEENVLGTKQLFWRSKIDTKALAGADDLIAESQKTSSTSSNGGAVVVLGWGRWKTVREGLTQEDEITAESMIEFAKQIRTGAASDSLIQAASQLLLATSNQPTKLGESEVVQGSVVIEGHN